MIPLALLIGVFLAAGTRRKRLDCLVAPSLQERLTPRGIALLRWVRIGCALLALGFFAIALARPQTGYILQDVPIAARDLILAVDVSRSMMAPDVTPTRLDRAKMVAEDFLSLIAGDRAGLVAFAGKAFLQAPLTPDLQAISAAVQELDPDIIPRGGSDIGQAIEEAMVAFGSAEGANRLLVIMADGEELNANALQQAKVAAEANIRISTIGFGSAEGSLIPLPDRPGEFVRDQSGEPVTTRLDEERLRNIASLAGGHYERFVPGVDVASVILQRSFEDLSRRDVATRSRQIPIERFQWPLAVGLFLLTLCWVVPERLLSKRPAIAKAAPMLLFLLSPQLPLRAESASEALDGFSLYRKARYAEAAEAFARESAYHRHQYLAEYNAGAALYKAGEYDKAIEAFSQALASHPLVSHDDTHYNLANSLYQSAGGTSSLEQQIARLQDAIGHYDAALEINPNHAAASHNRAIARDVLDQKLQQQKEKQQQEQQPQEDQQQEQKEQPDDQESSDQQANEQNQQSSDPQEGEKQDSQEQESDQASGQESQEDQQDGRQESSDPSQDGSGDEPSAEQDPSQSSEGQSSQPSAQPQPDNQGEEDRERPAEPSQQADQESGAEERLSQMVEESAGEEEGNMSVFQARQLLDALRDEEVRVFLREREYSEPVYQDW